jgi:hypothetical protein
MLWYLAICQDCTPVLPQPFTVEAEWIDWTREHVTSTGHRVLLKIDDQRKQSR